MHQEPIEDEKPNYGDAVGRDFVDKLLLSLIDAYPEFADISKSPAALSKRRNERLRVAKLAVFGGTIAGGRPKVTDAYILRWIGNENYKDRAKQRISILKNESPPKLRSDRQLVEDAVSHFKLVESSIERLRKKWSTEKEKWFQVALDHDDVPEQLELNALQQVQDILQRHGIVMRLDNLEN
ncbi:hypothetical protein QQF51_01705 [Brucella intermedia]|uniref:hypothetical protein n=1 Tax=Brucella intermedia TaxID=94625 RepID=UPI002552B18C|nr:hypothetical protein [Brucella intermedia]MDL2201373.1 hypothetical protein [Brucella intermedia]